MKRNRKTVERELRRVALVCPAGVEREIILQVRREHRETTAPDRSFIKDLKADGICPPVNLAREEWVDKLPRPLRGRRPRCLPLDELAQELADRGTISDASSEAALDHVAAAYKRARSEPSIPDERDLKREARKIVGQRVARAIRELKREIRRECPAPEKPQTTER